MFSRLFVLLLLISWTLTLLQTTTEGFNTVVVAKRRRRMRRCSVFISHPNGSDTSRQRVAGVVRLGSESQEDDTDGDEEGRVARPRQEEEDRSEVPLPLRRLLSSAAQITGPDNDNNSNKNIIPVGSTVVASANIPNLGIWQFQSYELRSVFDQGLDKETGLPTKIYRHGLDTSKVPSGYVRYVTLYSPKHHDHAADGQKGSGPVTVSPDEIGLVSLKDEVINSIIWALPLFGFWTALAISFANQYNERYGGNFIDALLRR